MIFVTGLPRSRTAWFAAYLCGLGKLVLHEGLDGLKSKQEFSDLMSTCDGDSDPSLVFTDFQSMFPGHKTLIIHRPIKDVKRSLDAIGIVFPLRYLKYLTMKMAHLDGLHVQFDDIDERLEDITKFFGIEYNPIIADIYMNMVVKQKITVSDVESLKAWVS